MASDDPSAPPLFNLPGAQEVLDLNTPYDGAPDEEDAQSFHDRPVVDDHLDDLEPLARDILEIWHDGSELAWLRHVWGALAERGLTTFETAVERARVVCRLAAVAAFYREFCVRALDEGLPGEWRDTVLRLVGEYPLLDPFVVGALAERDGAAVEGEPHDEVDGMSPLQFSLAELIRNGYVAVTEALRDQWDDSVIVAEALLGCRPDITYPITDEQWDSAVNSDVTIGASKGYEWVSDGMPLE